MPPQIAVLKNHMPAGTDFDEGRCGRSKEVRPGRVAGGGFGYGP